MPDHFETSASGRRCDCSPQRKPFLTDVLGGFGVLGNDLPGHTYEYYASDIDPQDDPDKAKSLLKQAGASDLRLTLYTSEETYGMNESATLWAAQAQAAGVKVAVKQISPPTYYTSATPGYLTDQRPFSMDYINLAPPSLGGFYIQFLVSSAEFNEIGWGLGPEGPARDALIYDALGETDKAKAADKWHAVQEEQATHATGQRGWTAPVGDRPHGSAAGAPKTDAGGAPAYVSSAAILHIIASVPLAATTETPARDR